LQKYSRRRRTRRAFSDGGPAQQKPTEGRVFGVRSTLPLTILLKGWKKQETAEGHSAVQIFRPAL